MCHITGRGLLAQCPGLFSSGVVNASVLHTLNMQRQLQIQDMLKSSRSDFMMLDREMMREVAVKESLALSLVKRIVVREVTVNDPEVGISVRS